ncbi:CDP-glycerol glycerophosphotransferase family protein [bacterium]|nr:CDP-glycerol glycerophosphotransferase family protein [bacterium]
MENRWNKLIDITSKVIEQEPALEGLLWKFYMLRSKSKTHPVHIHYLKSLCGTIKKQPKLSSSLWYAIHGYIPAHILNMEPIVQECEKRHISGTIIGPHPYVNHTIPGVTSWSQIKPFDILSFLSARKLHQLLLKSYHWASIIHDLFLESTYFSSDISPDRNSYVTMIYQCLMFDEACSVMLQKYQPRCILAGTDVGIILNPLIRNARTYGCHTIVIQHGNQGDYAGTIHSDIVALWGEYHREKTLGHKVPAELLKVFGCPRMDYIRDSLASSNATHSIREKLHINPDTKIILHASDGKIKGFYPDILIKSIWDTLPRVFEKLSEKYAVIVRLHPGETSAEWDKAFKGKNIHIVGVEYDIYELIMMAHVVSTVGSTAGLEAIYLEKPVLFYQPEGIDHPFNYFKQNIGIMIRNAQEWITITEKLMQDQYYYSTEKQRNLVNIDYLYAHRGNVSQLIVDYIEDFLR